MKEANNMVNDAPQHNSNGVSRRRFLGYAGALAGAGLLLDSCKKEEEPVKPADGMIDLGQNDNGLLNYAFVIQQIEASFYERAIAQPYNDMSALNKLYFTDMYWQEVAHRELFRNYLKNAGPVVNTDFSSVNFSSRDSVLEAAEIIENLSVASCNELGRLFVSGEHVAVIAKIASVEARHATTISNIRNRGNFFGPVDVIGQEPGSLPSNSITTLNRFLATKVSGSNLPNK